MKFLVLIATALVMLLSNPGSLLAGPAPLGRSTEASNTSTSAYCGDAEEMAFLTLINTYRSQNGLPALVMSQTLSAAAYHHSADMAVNNYFSHTLFNGTTWDANIRDHGYTFGTALAENIAAGNSTASATIMQWKNSAGHNANMLSANYTAIGIGRAYSSASTYGYYWTTTFGGVQDAAAVACSTATPTPTPTATATATPSATVSVSALVVSKATAKSVTTVSYSVTVKDSAGKLVSGGSVTVSVTTPKGNVMTVSGMISSKGVVKLSVKASDGSGSYMGKVTNIAVSGKSYDPSKNKVTMISIIV